MFIPASMLTEGVWEISSNKLMSSRFHFYRSMDNDNPLTYLFLYHTFLPTRMFSGSSSETDEGTSDDGPQRMDLLQAQYLSVVDRYADDTLTLRDEVMKSETVTNVKKRSKKNCLTKHFAMVEDIISFSKAGCVTLEWIKRLAKELRLIITQTGRSRAGVASRGRIGFGLSQVVMKVVSNDGPRTLFHFNLREDGFYHGSKWLIQCM